MAGPAATVSSNHICPMCSGLVPHVGGTITQGEPTVLIEGKHTATIGSLCACVGLPDIIATGVSNVFIGGKPAATMGSMTAHGGSVVMGAGTVLIGTRSSAPTAVMPIAKIPFPKITTIDRVKAAIIGESKNLRIAKENQQEIRELAEQEEQKPQIIDIQFIDENDVILSQSIITGVEGGNATDFIYGKKLKIKITTQNVDDGKKIKCNLRGYTKSVNQNFLGISNLDWELTVTNNECETIFFTIPILWYSEEFEKYNYPAVPAIAAKAKTPFIPAIPATNPNLNLYTTFINADDLNSFMVYVNLEGARSYLHEKEHWLKPIAYRRNYEELMGLYKYEDVTKSTPHSTTKNLVDNFEKHFIIKNSKISTIVNCFIEEVTKEGVTLNEIKTVIVPEKAKALWDAAVKKVQSGNLDDRPLYWARNKMQTFLKRNPLFEKDIDFEISLVNVKSELGKIIKTFEEKSRNYKGVDFSSVSGKKVLALIRLR